MTIQLSLSIQKSERKNSKAHEHPVIPYHTKVCMEEFQKHMTIQLSLSIQKSERKNSKAHDHPVIPFHTKV